MILDSSAIIAMADRTARDHPRIISAVTDSARRPLIPAPVLGEVGYLLQVAFGPRAVDAFLGRVSSGAFEVVFEPADASVARRMLAVRPSVGSTDALIAACSIRTQLPVLTLDRRDFEPLSVEFGFQLAAY
ncbi:MAG: PIN domain-containing protein [Actinomycetota bacterium]